ncbi:MAG: hypothetical protein KJ621_05910 [Proteobacteria bacterium]|nr:hypothetical protein [Pseudomonadota bacterium]MBU1740374.1 hypothetical protein [Pseudomonadota bacterium]
MFKRTTLRWAMIGLALMTLASCETYTRVKDAMLDYVAGGLSAPSLKKRIVVLPFHTLLPKGRRDFHVRATKLLTTLLRRSGHFVVLPSNVLTLPPVPVGGINDWYAEKIVIAGRKAGVNVVIFGMVSDLAVSTQLVGLWGFREPAPFLRVEMEVRAYNMADETLIARYSRRGELEMTDIERMLMQRGKLPLGEGVDQMIFKLCQRLARDLKSGLKRIPWTGFVVRRQGKYVVLAIGRDTGVRRGSGFEVFGPGEPIKTATGRTYRIPGTLIGRVRVVSVHARHSLALPSRGKTVADFPPGSTIQPD